MTDTELLRLAQRGDMAAWRSLYARCVPSVWRQAVAMVGDYSIAEEVVSETLLALVRGISELDADTVQLHAWLRGVVRHKVGDHVRQQSKQSRLLAAARNGSSREGDTAAVSSPLEAEEDRQQVLQAIGQLPDLQRLALEWKHVDGLSVQEIAERTGQTEKAIESTLYRARKEFRRLYEQVRSGNALNGDSPRHNTGTLEKSL